MPKHIARLIVLLVIFGAVGYAAKVFFTADSFYAYGHYRGNSVAEIASEKPKYKGSDYCRSCHAERYAEWAKGVHHNAESGKVVQCEVCHGVAGGRDTVARFEYATTGVDHPASGKLPLPADTVKLCTLCHETMAGRPAEQRQIAVAAHAGTQQCKECHNPHSPRIILGVDTSMAQPGKAVAGPAGSCAACHGADGISRNLAWPSLAGQRSAYLVEALKAYRTGARDNAMMAGIAKGLSDADAQKVAAHYEALKSAVPAAGTARKDVGAGKARASACAACHGASGVSGNPAWPNLAGQPRDYLVAALAAYKNGSRKNDVMAGIAKDLSDADVQALAAYYASLGSR
jgi:cytochrome c553